MLTIADNIHKFIRLLVRVVATGMVGSVSIRPHLEANNHISADIHEFGGVPSRLVGSHAATVDRARYR